MTNEEAYNIISEFCFTGYEDNKKPSFKLFGAIHELILDVEENTKLKAEIERLNGKSEMYRDMADSFCNSNTKLKAEIEQLKSEVHANKCWSDVVERTLKKEIDKNLELKSELEQSVKEKSEVISKIEYALNECEPVYNKCAVIPQAKPIYDLAMNYCLDLLKGATNE